eukprot:TRINITY_DN4034_c0_g1_i1.p1 TRINITY_DN4034_c0_g1~~TRINITY_DN4034_c0_g1_i1.p1  ORF type:complete len:236 (+),score=54.62 TRINITY_DN4034_c0_g1_i1:92-799(+)
MPPSAKINNVGKSKLWTKEEDRILVTAIQTMPKSCWKKISEELGGRRTAEQCCQRWHRVLSPKVKENQWSKEQDELLIALVARHGDRAWRTIALHVPQRSELQCRLRHVQLMRRANPVFHHIGPAHTDSRAPLFHIAPRAPSHGHQDSLHHHQDSLHHHQDSLHHHQDSLHHHQESFHSHENHSYNRKTNTTTFHAPTSPDRLRFIPAESPEAKVLSPPQFSPRDPRMDIASLLN